ncbi:PP2C family protein-serine/threonine phosphatase [Streptomyces odontomachi]|uniref:PP2C family protein-serine/threonine phosphatase n=1 Tax=Streptomyces odontomachi TaxID=2944940 RepID=UPI00210E4D1C|nr:SpoIIE family protein phosphatase [Streptomyces sp. ODS25]
MSEALFGAIAKLLPHPLVVCTVSGRVLVANPAAARAADCLRRGAELTRLSLHGPELRDRLRQFALSGHPLPGVLVVPDKDGETVRFRVHGARAAWWEGPETAVQLFLWPLKFDRFVALSDQLRLQEQQIVHRRAMAAEERKLLTAEQQAREQMQRLYRLTAALAAAGNLQEVCEAVHKCAPQVLDASTVGLELHSQRIVPPLNPQEKPALPAVGFADLDAPKASTAVDRPFTRVPLVAEGITLGYLCATPAPVTRWDDERATAVALQIAQAVRRAGLFEHEHRLAERLQRSLLPDLPEVSGLDIAGGYAPGTHMVDVGGDWYDVHLLDDDTIGLTIGDVAGHGVAQATSMAQISTALRSIARRSGRHPAAVLQELNDFLVTYHEWLMATACYAVYRRSTRTLSYARAGHPPLLLIGPDGSGRYLEDALAPPLGPVGEVHWVEAEVTIPEGAALVLYTDGLVERRGEILDVGLERLAQLSPTTVGLDAKEICALLLHQQPEAELPDDRALLVVRFPA